MPKRINLNNLVLCSSRNPVSSNGETPVITYNPDVNLWDIVSENAMLEKALADLVSLSRSRVTGDAIWSIETQNITLNHAYCNTHSKVIPGDYALLCFSDNGRGYSERELEDMLVEKPSSMEANAKPGDLFQACRGIVERYQGVVHVYSELESGTTYKIYMPRAMGRRDKEDAEWFGNLPSGEETVLFAEDDAHLSEICITVLTQNGYRVLNTSGGEEALEIAKNSVDPIHLLITDVIMPNMAGNELYKSVHSLHPETKVLFTSGYTRYSLIQQGVMSDKGHFLQKPFSKAGLLWMVRATLENPQSL